jgi:hypothetical protein
VTRRDAAALLARGIGLRPATLDVVMQTRFSGVPLLPELHRGEVPDALLSRRDADDTLARVAQLTPRDVYRLVDVRITDPRGRTPLDGPPYRLVNGQPVVLIASTAGAPFKAAAADLRFTLKSDAFDRPVTGAAQSATRLRSEVWDVELPASETPTVVRIEVSVRHPLDGWLLLGEQHVLVQVS